MYMALPSLNSNNSSTSTTELPTIKFNIPTLTIIEDFDKLIAKEVIFDETGEKHIVKLLHFPNITPSEQKRLLMSGSSSASSDDEQDPSQEGVQKTQRKKSSTKRTLDLQRKISLSKLREEKKEPKLHNLQNAVENHNNNNNHSAGITDSSSATSINIEKSAPITIKHGKNRQAKNGKISGGYEQFSMSLLTVPMPKDYGEPSSDDLSSEWDSDTVNEVNKTNGTANKESKKSMIGWRKLRNIVQWTPFFQTYKNKQRYPWVQLAGHQGNFKAGLDAGTVLKKLTPKEEVCFKELMKDVLRPYVPEFKGIVDGDDSESQYLQLQDLLSDFNKPCCVMDCKIGVRTYLEEELLKAKEKQKLRKDMYEKMIQIDPNAPTEEEHQAKGVTKPRYMVWRETISSTANLGFRIEGIKKDDLKSKDFKTIKTRDDIVEMFKEFIKGYPFALRKYIQRLKAIRATLEHSEFFKSHEIIGSSLLFVHDRSNASCWLIDFAKTGNLPDDIKITHKKNWEVGNHEDGYLIGLNNIIELFCSIARETEYFDKSDEEDDEELNSSD
ncbi:inositol-trisphosphate 3-kinase A-like [Chironomus tepperi]|uniref:inositol-trisphosphate 3-kinase A-like n=1 Tax=Chironomus tepperi TaxID=113505 RepID=UPI00391F3A7B